MKKRLNTPAVRDRACGRGAPAWPRRAAASFNLVYGENIAQTAQFVRSGAADIGIIALSLAIAPQMRDADRYWEIPLDAYPKMEQGGIILKGTKEPDAARAFRDFVLGQHGREVLKRYGFFLPEK